MALAIDHRSQLEAMADRAGAPRERIGRIQGTRRRGDRPRRRRRAGLRHAHRRHLRHAGALRRRRPSVLDRPAGRAAGLAAAGIRGRRRPRRATWSNGRSSRRSSACASITRTIPTSSRRARSVNCCRVFDAARTVGRELMVEIIAGKNGRGRRRYRRQRARAALRPRHPARLVEAGAAGERRRLGRDRPRHRHPRSEMPRRRLLGLEAPEADLARGFALAAGSERVKGFAVGRTIFGEAAAAWLAGRIDDEAAIDDMAARFAAAGRRLAERGRRRRAPPEALGGERCKRFA